MKVDFANLQMQYRKYKDDIDQRIQQVLDQSNYIMGEEVFELEKALARFTHCEQVVSCSSGTDALLLAMMAIDIAPGDEIITTPFSFIATAETIALMGAKPVFVDIDSKTYNLDAEKIAAAITDKTRAIMPVSLYGQPADLAPIQTVARRHDLKVIVDGAQSFGAQYQGKHEVHHCDIYTTSFFPAKPLGCYGDGGAVLTQNESYAEKMRMLRVHGQNKRYHHQYIGIGGRLDTLQAAILLAKLPHYADELSMREEVAARYRRGLESRLGADCLPQVKSDRTSVYAQFTLCLEARETVQGKLKESGVPTAIHYPMPLHRQACFAYLGIEQGAFPHAEAAARQVLSLPMNAFLTPEQVEFICACL